MDWSKAKNIIIAALLIANLMIGGNLLAQRNMERQQIRQQAADTCAFLEQAGITIDADISQEAERMPVIFLRLQREEEAPKEEQYKEYPIVVQGTGFGYEIAGAGQQAAQTITAFEALLKLYAILSEEGNVQGKHIEAIDLVYLLSPDETSFAAQDTASPAWRILVSGRTYYVDAYRE